MGGASGKGSGFSNFSSVTTMLKGFMELQKQQLEVDRAKAEAEKAKINLAMDDFDEYEDEDEDSSSNQAKRRPKRSSFFKPSFKKVSPVMLDEKTLLDESQVLAELLKTNPLTMKLLGSKSSSTSSLLSLPWDIDSVQKEKTSTLKKPLKVSSDIKYLPPPSTPLSSKMLPLLKPSAREAQSQGDWSKSASKWMGGSSGGSSPGGWQGGSGASWPGAQAGNAQQPQTKRSTKRQAWQTRRRDQQFGPAAAANAGPDQGPPPSAQMPPPPPPPPPPAQDSFWANLGSKASSWFGGGTPPPSQSGQADPGASTGSWSGQASGSQTGSQGWGSSSPPPSAPPSPGADVMGQASIPDNSWSGQPPPPPPPPPAWSNQGSQAAQRRRRDMYGPMHGSVSLSNIPGIMPSPPQVPSSPSLPSMNNDNIPNLSFSLNPPTPAPEPEPEQILEPEYQTVVIQDPSYRPLSSGPSYFAQPSPQPNLVQISPVSYSKPYPIYLDRPLMVSSSPDVAFSNELLSRPVLYQTTAKRRELGEKQSRMTEFDDDSPLVIETIKKTPLNSVVKKIVLDPKNGIIVSQNNDGDLSTPSFPVFSRKKRETSTETSKESEETTTTTTEASSETTASTEEPPKPDPNGHQHGKMNAMPSSEVMSKFMGNFMGGYADFFGGGSSGAMDNDDDFARDIRMKRDLVQYQPGEAGGSDYDYNRGSRRVQVGFSQSSMDLPEGTREKISAGGGRSPGHHEGGGLTVQVRELQSEDENEEYEDQEPGEDQSDEDYQYDNEDVYNETDDQLSQEEGNRKRAEVLTMISKSPKFAKHRGQKTLNFFFTW